mmetsp:Transcript_58011/g.154959  ORF Transcript_58011/g.154959 Transcript_58011/m.154959 type:complete len:374 (+) Transcript_58011:470-1591(+)
MAQVLPPLAPLQPRLPQLLSASCAPRDAWPWLPRPPPLSVQLPRRRQQLLRQLPLPSSFELLGGLSWPPHLRHSPRELALRRLLQLPLRPLLPPSFSPEQPGGHAWLPPQLQRLPGRRRHRFRRRSLPARQRAPLRRRLLPRLPPPPSSFSPPCAPPSRLSSPLRHPRRPPEARPPPHQQLRQQPQLLPPPPCASPWRPALPSSLQPQLLPRRPPPRRLAPLRRPEPELERQQAPAQAPQPLAPQQAPGPPALVRRRAQTLRELRRPGPRVPGWARPQPLVAQPAQREPLRLAAPRVGSKAPMVASRRDPPHSLGWHPGHHFCHCHCPDQPSSCLWTSFSCRPHHRPPLRLFLISHCVWTRLQRRFSLLPLFP